MKTINFYSTIIFTLVLNTLFAQGPVQKHGRLQVNGSHVTAENGDKISLAGPSLFWSNDEGDSADFYNKETIDFLSENWGIGIIRAAMGVKESWDGGRGYIESPAFQKAKIKKVIDAAIENNVYVIVDWHTHEAEIYTNEAVQFFSEIAEEYGDNDHIIYEIYNEPRAQSWDIIKNYAETVISAIREKDPDNLIIVGNREWSQQIEEAAAKPINDNNVAYTLHFYSGNHKQWLRDRAIRVMNSGIALFVTEWGSVNADGKGAVDVEETEKWLQFMKDNYISHVNWSLSDKNESASIINPGKGFEGLKNDELTQSGELIKKIIIDQKVTLSTNDFNLNNTPFKIHPNPTSDFVTIPQIFNKEQFVLADMNGKIIEQLIVKDNTIDLSKYPVGVYIVHMHKGDGNLSSELIIKN